MSPSKSPEQPEPSPTGEAGRRILMEKIHGRVNEGKLTRRQAKTVAIYLLSDPVLRIMDENNLHKIYPKQDIDAAIDAADDAVTNGSPFGEQIREIRSEIEGVELRTPEPPREITREMVEDLVRLAENRYKKDLPGLNGKERNANEKLMRWAIILIARRCMDKGIAEAGAIAKVAKSTSHMMFKQAREEYAARDTFYNNIRSICKELDLPSPEVEMQV